MDNLNNDSIIELDGLHNQDVDEMDTLEKIVKYYYEDLENPPTLENITPPCSSPNTSEATSLSLSDVESMCSDTGISPFSCFYEENIPNSKCPANAKFLSMDCIDLESGPSGTSLNDCSQILHDITVPKNNSPNFSGCDCIPRGCVFNFLDCALEEDKDVNIQAFETTVAEVYYKPDGLFGHKANNADAVSKNPTCIASSSTSSEAMLPTVGIVKLWDCNKRRLSNIERLKQQYSELALQTESISAPFYNTWDALEMWKNHAEEISANLTVLMDISSDDNSSD